MKVRVCRHRCQTQVQGHMVYQYSFPASLLKNTNGITLPKKHVLITGDDSLIKTSNSYTPLRCISCTKNSIHSIRGIAFDNRLGNAICTADLTKHARTGTRNALLSTWVNLNQTEAHPPAFIPFEVIHQGPVQIPTHRNTFANSAVNHCQVFENG